jgi:hypothetical protein
MAFPFGFWLGCVWPLRGSPWGADPELVSNYNCYSSSKKGGA